jgi:hypothetical protein
MPLDHGVHPLDHARLAHAETLGQLVLGQAAF